MTTQTFPEFDSEEATLLYSELMQKFRKFEGLTPDEYKFVLAYGSHHLRIKLSKPENMKVLKRLKDR